MSVLIRLIRPRQWSKNSLNFAAIIFSHHFGSLSDWGRVCILFIAFSLVASSVYIINDILDVKADREHPVKRNRPIASGQIKRSSALILTIILLIIGFVLVWQLGVETSLILLGYAVVMIAYSLVLKRLMLVDVFIIAGGLTVRAVIGAVAIDVIISNWLLVCTFFIGLMLALVKRRQELVRFGDEMEKSRQSLTAAPPIRIWDLWITMMSGISLLAYTLYTVDPSTIQKIGSANLLYTVPFVAYAIFRYQLIVYVKNRGEDPAATILEDKQILLTVLAWLVVVVLILI